MVSQFILPDPGTGFIIANATTDSNGNLAQNFTLTDSLLKHISDDGQSVHTVWIIGLNGSSGSNPIPITDDSEQNYSAATQGNGIIFFVTLFTFVVPVHFDSRNSVHSAMDNLRSPFCSGFKRPLQEFDRSA